MFSSAFVPFESDFVPSSTKFYEMLESCISMEPGIFEFEDHELFDLNESVWVLGHEYDPKLGIDAIKRDIISRPWCTYRRNFDAIGGTGPTTDQGWGCMLRCGQMLLAHTLVTLHLGRHWRWQRATDDRQSRVYLDLLRHFQDKKHRLYSLHQIAQMGVSEGKQIGEWFGPNTTAQVLRKLTVYDDVSSLAVHIAMDNTVIVEDVLKTCKARANIRRQQSSPFPAESSSSQQTADAVDNSLDANTSTSSLFISAVCDDSDAAAAVHPHVQDTTCSPPRLSSSSADNAQPPGDGDFWRPLLLIVPLRLGLTTLNPCYKEAIKIYFSLPQCAGMMGGRPNHALYFVGCAGDELLYLDPHTCQDSVDLDPPPVPVASNNNDRAKDNMNSGGDGDNCKADTSSATPTAVDDSSYHCAFTLHLPIENVDPSLALAFLCPTEQDFRRLCEQFKQRLLPASKPPILELLERRPSFLPKFQPYVGEDTPKMTEFTDLGTKCDSDDEFVILDGC